MRSLPQSNRAARRSSPTLAGLGLLLAGLSWGHEPHKPANAPVASPATASTAARSAAPLPLPGGWVESPPPAAAKAFAPMLAADGPGVLATWLEPLPAGGHRLRFARWSDGSWSAATTVGAGRTLFANWADVPGVVRAPDRSLYVWWLEKSAGLGEAYNAKLARSTDQGAAFHPLGALHEDRSEVEHGFVSAAAEGTGVRFFYLDGRVTGKGEPMQLRSVFVAGDRIGSSEIIDDSVCDCCSTAAVTLAGASAVAYRDRTAAEIRDIRLVVRPIAGAPATQPVGADNWRIAGCPVNGPALAATGHRLAVAWYSAPGDRARMAVALSTDGGKSWSVPRPIPAAKPMGQLGLASIASGFALSWLEGVEGGAELRVAITDSNGEVGPSLAVARTAGGRAAGIPRLASAANRLALLWVDAGGAGLRFASSPTLRGSR